MKHQILFVVAYFHTILWAFFVDWPLAISKHHRIDVKLHSIQSLRETQNKTLWLKVIWKDLTVQFLWNVVLHSLDGRKSSRWWFGSVLKIFFRFSVFSSLIGISCAVAITVALCVWFNEIDGISDKTGVAVAVFSCRFLITTTCIFQTLP